MVMNDDDDDDLSSSQNFCPTLKCSSVEFPLATTSIHIS